MIVTATAPVRVCDLGGWTDTWFARRGLVVSVAVAPGATARVTHRPGPVTIDAPDLPGGPDRLLWAVVEEVGVTADRAVEVWCGVPPGAAMGTSASVTVALLAALGATGDLAARAHAVEVTRLGREGGVQDQVAAARGGINLIEIDPYPTTRVTPLAAPPGLAERLCTVYLGAPHDSAAVHDEVIGSGPDAPVLERLRRAASSGAEALARGDLAAFGRAMIANTDAQAELTPGVVGPAALEVIAIARAHGAAGWKVNGAGGAGGTVTVLLDAAGAGRASGVRAGAGAGARRAFEAAVSAAGYRPLDVALCPDGVRVAYADVRSNT